MPLRVVDLAVVSYLVLGVLAEVLLGLQSPARLWPGAHALGFAGLLLWCLVERSRSVNPEERRELAWTMAFYAFMAFCAAFRAAEATVSVCCGVACP